MGKKGEKDLIAERATKGVKGGFLVVVNYARTFEQLLSDSFCHAVVPDEIMRTIRMRGGGKIQRELVLVHLGLSVTTKQAKVELKERDLEPAKIEDILAFAVEHFSQEHKFRIVALGSPVEYLKETNFPMLNNELEQRSLDFRAPRLGEWDENTRFLAVRRKKGWLNFLRRR